MKAQKKSEIWGFASTTCQKVNHMRFTFYRNLIKIGDEKMVLMEKLRQLRKMIGLSQQELSERVQVSRQAVSGWEAGNTRPSIENLQCLSKLYNVPLEVLLDDAQEARPGELAAGDQQREDCNVQGCKNKKRKLVAVGLILVILGILIGVLFTYLKDSKEVVDISDVPGESVVIDSEKMFVFEW